MDVVFSAVSTRFAWILGRRGVRAANKPLPAGVERCSLGCTRDSRVKGFSNVAEVMGSLTARGAEAWTSGGIRQQSLAIVGHFFRSGEMAFFVSLLSFDLVSRKVYGTERRSTSRPRGRRPGGGYGVEVPVVNR